MSLVNFRDAKGELLERCYEPIGVRAYSGKLVVPSASDSERSRNFTVSTTPTQYGLLPEKLIVPYRIAPNFVIRNVRIGNVSQMMGPLPASLFSPTGLGGMVGMDPVERDIMFAIDLTYTGNDPIAEFQAAVVGQARDGRRCVLPLYAKVPIGYSYPFRSGLTALRYVSDIILLRA